MEEITEGFALLLGSPSYVKENDAENIAFSKNMLLPVLTNNVLNHGADLCKVNALDFELRGPWFEPQPGRQ